MTAKRSLDSKAGISYKNVRGGNNFWGVEGGVIIIPRHPRCKMEPKSWHLLREACQSVQSSSWDPEIPLTHTLPGWGGNIIPLHRRKPGLGIGCDIPQISKQGHHSRKSGRVAAPSELEGPASPNLLLGGPGCVLATPSGQKWSLPPSAMSDPNSCVPQRAVTPATELHGG